MAITRIINITDTVKDVTNPGGTPASLTKGTYEIMNTGTSRIYYIWTQAMTTANPPAQFIYVKTSQMNLPYLLPGAKMVIRVVDSHSKFWMFCNDGFKSSIAIDNYFLQNYPR